MTNKNKQKRLYWLKVSEKFFNNKKINYLLNDSLGCEYCVIYQLLCLNSVETNGVLSREDVLNIQFNYPSISLKAIKSGIKILDKLKLIKIDKDIIMVLDLENLVDSESLSAIEKRNQRSRLSTTKKSTTITKPIVKLILRNDEYYNIDQKMYNLLKKKYPNIDLDIELKAMETWCLREKSKRKPKQGINAFIDNWLLKSERNLSAQKQQTNGNTQHFSMERQKNTNQTNQHDWNDFEKMCNDDFDKFVNGI